MRVAFMRSFAPGWHRKIELAANLVILASGLVLGVRFVKSWISRSSEPVTIRAGAKLNLSEVDWSRYEKTLVFALKEGCPFCTQSAPFYQNLARAAGREKNLHLIANFAPAAFGWKKISR